MSVHTHRVANGEEEIDNKGNRKEKREGKKEEEKKIKINIVWLLT
jgi:hypothetical protein